MMRAKTRVGQVLAPAGVAASATSGTIRATVGRPGAAPEHMRAAFGRRLRSALADHAQAKPGDTVTHTATVRNSGNGEAKSAVLRNTLPAGVKPMESKPSQGEFDPATALWKTGPIKAGSEVAPILVLGVPHGAAGSEMTARSSFIGAPGAESVVRDACGGDAEAAWANTHAVDSTTRK